MTVIISYLVLVNIAGMMLMAVDKRRAEKGEWRISEKKLFFAAFIGGSAGCWLGMYVFRHKTEHAKFVVGMPAIFAAQAALIAYVI